MIKEFQTISNTEKQAMIESPVLIMLLIAGADGEIDEKEKEWAEKISVLRARKEESILSEFYEEVSFNFKKNAKEITEIMPKKTAERSSYLTSRLEKINEILPKIDKKFASEFYKDMLSFARQVAKAEGGIFGIGAISPEEEEYIKLSMIRNPEE